MKMWFILSFCLATLSATLFSQTSPQDFSEGFTAVAEKAIPAVVSIRVEIGPDQADEDGDVLNRLEDDFLRKFFGQGLAPFGLGRRESAPVYAKGSGVFVSNDGVILTNNHVINGSKKITVTLNDGEEFEAKVLGVDPQTDLAVIKIDANHTSYLPLGDSSKLKIAEPVIAAGNPFGLKATITKGIVSATGRANLDITNFEDFIQTDAAINRGNSGGPLLNLKGEVIGINTAIASNSTGAYMGIGFAIPSNMAKEVLAQILKTGTVSRGFLGVELQPMTLELAHAFKLDKPQGAILADVTGGSAAEFAGLQRGDVILTLNGKTVESHAALRTQVAMMAPGTEIHLGIKRGDNTLSVPVVLGTRPEGQKPIQEDEPSGVIRLGIVVEPLTPEAAKSFGHGGEQGVVVSKVDPKGPIARIGLKVGALILSVNHQKVTTPEDFLSAVSKTDDKGGILLQIKQEGSIRYVYLRGI